MTATTTLSIIVLIDELRAFIDERIAVLIQYKCALLYDLILVLLISVTRIAMLLLQTLRLNLRQLPIH
jgi:hypothetical protein